MRLLIVEDDRIFSDALVRHLSRDGYAVDWIQHGQGMADALASNEYDCLLLDLTLPDAKGEDLIRMARSRYPAMPSLVITARSGKVDRISVLDLGADDYLVKPIDLDEASARIRALTRRGARAQLWNSEIRHGPLKLDRARRSATWYDKAVSLTNKEFWLLETFVRNKTQVLTRAQLEQTLYGWEDQIDSNAVEVYIHYLRRKFSVRLIVTVRGVGYQLGLADAPDSDAEPELKLA
jgi:DNA-binding response OmpR family regulator